MNSKKIVLTGSPSSGKSSLIFELRHRGFLCYDEISRQITRQARIEGIEQLFLAKPLLFSEKLLEERSKQYHEAAKETSPVVFLDRGIPDIIAYMDYIGDEYPNHFNEACKTCVYDYVFILEPWEAIYKSDNERYENFEQAKAIHKHLIDTYKRFGYQLINIPFLSIAERTDFILDALDL